MALRPCGLRRAAIVVGLLAAACIDFHLEGPEDPAPVAAPRAVSVVIEYGQQEACHNAAGLCDTPVIFFGSWMRPGQELALTPVPGRFAWSGTARDVPVNFPPQGRPYSVRIFDPHLRQTSTEGFTARRLQVGGQLLTRLEGAGTDDEKGLVYVDDNGLGHNPF